MKKRTVLPENRRITVQSVTLGEQSAEHGAPVVRRVLIVALIAAVLCTVIPTAMIALGYKEPVRYAVNAVLTPVRAALSGVGDSVRGVSAYITEFDRMKAENEHLRAQLASMEDKIREAELTLAENAFLAQFLELKENHADYRFLKCEIVATAETGYRRTLTLNAGEGEGAAVGYPVITASGVIGAITEVGVNWSKVTPITELSSSVGAYVERSGDTGVACGSYLCRENGQLLLSYLDGDAEIAVGDRVRTSGVGSRYPRGLLIGTVTEISLDAATGAVSAVITPTADLSDLRDVMVLTDFAITEEIPA